MRVTKIPAADCAPWIQDDIKVYRPDGRFFSLVRTGNGFWILQPEVGLLGSLFRRSNGRHTILVQHKEEPGNIPLSQIAPTVQATASNIDLVHGGRKQPYLELFQQNGGANVLSESLNSEQGFRFWRKRNLNKTIEISEPINLRPRRVAGDFEWLDLSEFTYLLEQDLSVNTDSRSVIATTDWVHLLDYENPHKSGLESDKNLATANAKLQKAIIEARRSWLLDSPEFKTLDRDLGFRSHTPRQCEIGYFEISEANREIDSWNQPLIIDSTEDHFGLVLISDSVNTLAVLRISEEPGLWNGAEWGATWSRESLALGEDDFGAKLRATSEEITTILQTDEGGRFYQVYSRYTLSQLIVSPEEMNHIKKQVNHEAGFHMLELIALNRLCSQELSTTNELRTLASLVFSKVFRGELR